MKTIVLLIGVLFSTQILCQETLVDEGKVEIILTDSLGPPPQGPVYKSWEVGVNHPFTKSSQFHISRSTINFGLFADVSAFTIDDSTLFSGIGTIEPFGKLHVDYSSLGVSERPAIQVGEFAGSQQGYLTVNKPSNDENTAIAKFRDDGITIVDINKGNHTYQLDVNGDIFADNLMLPSDVSLKTEIIALKQSLSSINLLKPKAYQYKRSLTPTKQFGFLAQDLQKVFPNLVKKSQIIDNMGNNNEILAVNYIGLIPVLVSAYQELHDEFLEVEDQYRIQVLKNREMESRLNRLEELISKSKLKNKL